MNKKSTPKLIDYLFWIIFVFFTNPGGIITAITNEDRGDGGINIVDYLYVALFACYVLISIKPTFKYGKTFKKIGIYVLLFLVYDLLFFSYLVPTFKNPLYSPIFTFIKSRETIYSFTLFFMIYKFSRRSFNVFLNLLVLSTIIVVILFLVTVVTGVEILQFYQFDRHYVTINRLILTSYGLMPIIIPLGVILVTFNIKIRHKQYFLLAFGLMFLTWLLSLYRRYIFGTFIYLFISLLFSNYFEGKSLIPVGKIFKVAFYSLILGFVMYLSFPDYVDAGIITVQETINVIQYGEDSTGRKDERLGFTRDFIVNLILDNPLFGTGFNNHWRTSEGDELGYETSDYPLLAAIAMKGFIGILIFLPIYIILIRTIKFDVKYIKKSKVTRTNMEFFIVMFFIVFFSYDLMMYINWFSPVALSRDYEWLTLLAMYISSRERFYKKLNS